MHGVYFDAELSLRYVLRTRDGALEASAEITKTDAYSTPSIAVDRDQGVHVIFADSTCVHYAYRRPGRAFEIEPVVCDATTFGTRTLAVDDVGRVNAVVVAEGADGATSFLYASKPPMGTWTVESILRSDTISAPRSGSLALSHSGTHIGLENGDTGEVFRMWRLGGTAWRLELVDRGTRSGSYPSLAVNAAGIVHMTYRRDYHLTHAFRPITGQWSFELAVLEGGLHSSLAIDARGVLHVSHVHRPSGDVLYSSKAEGGTWTTTRVTEAASTSTALAYDALGRAHIAFTDLDTTSLRYATRCE